MFNKCSLLLLSASVPVLPAKITSSLSASLNAAQLSLFLVCMSSWHDPFCWYLTLRNIMRAKGCDFNGTTKWITVWHELNWFSVINFSFLYGTGDWTQGLRTEVYLQPLFFYYFILFCILRNSRTKLFNGGLNLWSFCLSLISTGITGTHHHAWFVNFFGQIFIVTFSKKCILYHGQVHVFTYL